MLIRRRTSVRAGFTLAEIIVATTVLSILGLAFTQLVLTQGRFSDLQNAQRGARAVARQSMNVLLSELRMVQDSGFVDSAATDGSAIRVLVPYWFGLSCDNITTGINRTIAAMLPVDSLQAAQAVYYGYAARESNGRYSMFVGGDPPTVANSGEATQCTNEGISAITVAGRTGTYLELFPQGPTDPGNVVFLFQRVTYSFKASAMFPGRLGLWRMVDGGADEELVAPFDTNSRFKYWAEGASASAAAPPALESLRGVDVVLAGLSTYTPSGKLSPAKSTLVTSVFFKNVRAY